MVSDRFWAQTQSHISQAFALILQIKQVQTHRINLFLVRKHVLFFLLGLGRCLVPSAKGPPDAQLSVTFAWFLLSDDVLSVHSLSYLRSPFPSEKSFLLV